MGKAEDELRRRLRAHADDRKHEEEQAQASADLALERLISEVQQLVPDALAGLHRTNWRNGELLEIRALLRSKEIAACPIGGYRFRAKGDGDADRFNYLYLLRDARWVYDPGDKPQTFAAIARRMADGWNVPGSLRSSRLPEGVIKGLEHLASAGQAGP